MSGMLIGNSFFLQSNGCGALLNKYFYRHEDSLQNLSIPDKNKDIGQDLDYLHCYRYLLGLHASG